MRPFPHAVPLLALALASLAAPAPPARAGSAASQALDQAYADAALADDFLTALTGGQQGLPVSMDAATAAQLAHQLVTGRTEEALELAVGYLKSKGVALAGTGAAGLVAATSAGRALGLKAHALFGDQKLKAIYAGLKRDIPKLSSWPGTLKQAQGDDFVAAHLDKLRVVAEWLKATTGEAGSDLYFRNKAYQALVAMRDFEMGCDAYGLQGAACTPETLREAALRDHELKAARARGAREARLFMLEVERQADLARQKEREARERRLAEDEARLLEDAEAARRLAEERARLEAEAARARDEAAALADRLPAMRARLAAGGAPPPAPREGDLAVAVRREPLGLDATRFRVTVTNRSGRAIEAFLPTLATAFVPESGGVAWGGGQGPRTLGAGASVELVCVGTGDIGAVVLTLLGDGQLLATETLPVSHEAPPAEDPAADLPPWLELPSRYRGPVTLRVVARVAGGETVETRSTFTQEIRFGADRVETVTTEAYPFEGVMLRPVNAPVAGGGLRTVGYRLERIPRDVKRSETRLPIALADGRPAAPPLPPDSPTARVRWTRWDGAFDADRVVVRHTLTTTYPGRPDATPPIPGWTLELHYDGVLPRAR